MNRAVVSLLQKRVARFYSRRAEDVQNTSPRYDWSEEKYRSLVCDYPGARKTTLPLGTAPHSEGWLTVQQCFRNRCHCPIMFGTLQGQCCCAVRLDDIAQEAAHVLSANDVQVGQCEKQRFANGESGGAAGVRGSRHMCDHLTS